MNGALWTILAACLALPLTPTSTQAGAGGADAVLDRAWERGLATARSRSEEIGPQVDHSTVENPWVIRTKNYEVRMPGRRTRGVRLAETAELMLKQYEALTGVTRSGRSLLRVDVMPTNDLYRQYGDDHSDTRSSIFGGFFDARNPGSAAAMQLEQEESWDPLYVIHATAQQFLFEASGGRELQAAFTQGFGAYMQASWSYDYFVNQFESYRDSGRLFNLGELLSTPIDGFGERAGIRLNQLAMTFVYLRYKKASTMSAFDENGQFVKSGPFDEYVRKAIRGDDLSDDPVFMLLSQDADALQKEILDFRGWR